MSNVALNIVINKFHTIISFHISFIVSYEIYFGETRIREDDMIAMLTLLTFINSCLNPIFYALYSK